MGKIVKKVKRQRKTLTSTYKKLKFDPFLEKKKTRFKQKRIVIKVLKKRWRRRKKVRKGKLLTKRIKLNPSYGVIHLLCNKRSIFCTLSDANGQIKASVSTGILKVKGKKRKSYYYVPKTGQLLINYLFKLPYRKFFVIIKGNAYKKKKRILIKTFLKIKKFKYLRLDNLAPRSHNGCRPPKIRRK